MVHVITQRGRELCFSLRIIGYRPLHQVRSLGMPATHCSKTDLERDPTKLSPTTSEADQNFSKVMAFGDFV